MFMSRALAKTSGKEGQGLISIYIGRSASNTTNEAGRGMILAWISGFSNGQAALCKCVSEGNIPSYNGHQAWLE